MTEFEALLPTDDLLRKRVERLIEQQLIALTQYCENLETQKAQYLDEIQEIDSRLLQYGKERSDCELILERLEYEREQRH